MTISLNSIGSITEIGSRHWSGEGIAAAVAARARVLADAGIGRGKRVVLVHGGSAQFLADLLAVWHRGAAAACLDPALTQPERDTVIAFLKPEAILWDGRVPAVGGGRQPICLADMAPGPCDDDAHTPAASGEAALILFTSGTTGTPKGVVLSYGALAARLALNVEEIGKAALARALLTLPTHFGHGLIGNALTPLLAGGELFIPPPDAVPGRDLGALIRDCNITFLSSVPALWRLALRLSEPPAASSLRRVHVGSAPLTAALWREIAAWTGAEVCNCYGMTETAGWIAGASSRAGDIHDGLVGRCWGGQAAVLAAGGKLMRAGEGEILIRSPALMSGYLFDEARPGCAFHGGWLRTGDSGHVAADGAITLAGRLKDEINRAGFKVQPAEVEALLASNAAIAAVCVFALPDAASGEIVAAAVEPAPGSMVTAAALEGWARKRVRRELIPERWFFVERIPATARGKTDRDKVRRMCLKSETRDS